MEDHQKFDVFPYNYTLRSLTYVKISKRRYFVKYLQTPKSLSERSPERKSGFWLEYMTLFLFSHSLNMSPEILTY